MSDGNKWFPVSPSRLDCLNGEQQALDGEFFLEAVRLSRQPHCRCNPKLALGIQPSCAFLAGELLVLIG